MTSKPISESGEPLLSSAALMWLIVKDQSNGRLEDASFTLGCWADAFHYKLGGVSEVIAASGLFPLAAFEEVVCVAVDS